jgi:hypothetical protein
MGTQNSEFEIVQQIMRTHQAHPASRMKNLDSRSIGGMTD